MILAFVQHVANFVYEIGRVEPDLAKRRKIDSLQLSEEEWKNVKLFLNLLGVSNSAISLACFVIMTRCSLAC